MNINKYGAVFLLLLTYAAFQNAGIVGDIVNDADTIANDAIGTADDVITDTADTADNIATDVIDDGYDNTNKYRNGYNNNRYNNNDGTYFFEDIAYTPGVTADKAVHPIKSLKRPLKTTGDVIPFQTYQDYRSDYDYRK